MIAYIIGDYMVTIEIKLEGETLQDIVKEIGHLIESNKPMIRNILEMLAVETLDILNEKKILNRGAELYINLTRNINWKYKNE